jgi:hypothetical protein
VRNPHEVVLVLGLGLPERPGGLDRGHGLLGPQSRGVDVGDRVAGDLLLLGREREDRRAVARSDVVALTVHRRRVVDLEEEREDVAVRGLRRVEDDLDSLGVTRVLTIGRVIVASARVADAGVQHARLAADQVLHAPEAAAREDGGLGAGGAGDLALVEWSAGHDAFSLLVAEPVEGSVSSKRLR